jgi:hypothetical protein
MEEWFIELSAIEDASRRPGLQSIVLLTIWEIWRERNNRVFRREAKTVSHIVASIQDEART